MARPVSRQSHAESVENQYDQVFVKAGRPVKFFFYTRQDGEDCDVSEQSARALGRKVERHGGVVINVESKADVVIVRDSDAAAAYGLRYCINGKPYVEPSSFIGRCITAKKYQHHPAPVQGMPGKPGGRRRVEYTADDDEHLAKYIASRLPDLEAGGRTGQRIYDDLVNNGQKWPEWKWAKRHTAQSWRERYKQNQARFSERISEIPPSADRKGADPRDRRAGRGGRGMIYQQAEEQGDHFQEREEEEEEDVQEYSDFERPVSVQPHAERYQNEKEEEDEEDEEDEEEYSDFERPVPEQGHNESFRRKTEEEPVTPGSQDVATPSPRKRQRPQEESESPDAGKRMKRARHADGGIRRPSDVEAGRHGRTSKTYTDGYDAQRRDSSPRRSVLFPHFEQDLEIDGFEQIPSPLSHGDNERRPGPSDAGPSNTQRTLVAEPSSSKAARQQTPSSRMAPSRPPRLQERPRLRPVTRAAMQDGMPMSSQATLVGPSTQLSSVQQGKLPESPEGDRRRSPSPEEAPQVVVPPPAAVPPVKRIIRRRRINVIEPPADTLPGDAPFRHTRARSRSVEPAPVPRRVDNGKQKAVMEVVPETTPEPEEEAEVQVQPASVPGETYRDEEDVAHLLGADEPMDEDLDDPFAGDSDDSAARPSLRRRVAQDNALSTDDERTGGHLFERNDMMKTKDWQQTSIDHINMPPPSTPRSRRSSVALTTSTHFLPIASMRQTPRSSGVAASSGSETPEEPDYIPLPNTRASSEKQRREQERRQEPYVPPRATHAAKKLAELQGLRH